MYLPFVFSPTVAVLAARNIAGRNAQTKASNNPRRYDTLSQRGFYDTKVSYHRIFEFGASSRHSENCATEPRLHHIIVTITFPQYSSFLYDSTIATVIILSPLRLLLPAISTISNVRFSYSTASTITTVVGMMLSSSSSSSFIGNGNNHMMTMNVHDDDDIVHSCLQVKFLSEHATLPTRGSPQSAGFDLSSAEKTKVPAGGRAIVKTDLSIACPEGTYARIAPRR